VMCLFICMGLSVQLMSYSAQIGSCFNQLWAEHFSQRNLYRHFILAPFSSHICSSGRADSFHKRSTMKRREGKQRCSNIYCCSATFSGEIQSFPWNYEFRVKKFQTKILQWVQVGYMLFSTWFERDYVS